MSRSGKALHNSQPTAVQQQITSSNSVGLSANLVTHLTASGTSIKYPRGATLFAEGEFSNALYVLVEGQLKVFTRDMKGRELVFNTIAAGEIFGEMFLDGGPRSASVRALVDSSCVVIDEDDLRGFMERYPEFAHYLVRKLIGRLRQSTQLSKSLALDGVHERTTMLLKSVAQEESGLRVIPASITQQEIADRVGATREMVNHVIRGLIEGGLAYRDEQRRLILEKPLLRPWHG